MVTGLISESRAEMWRAVEARAVEPLGESRHEIWVMQELAKKLKRPEIWLYEDPWEAMKVAMTDTFENGGLDDLLEGKVLKLRQMPREAYQTPSCKIEFFSSEAFKIGANPLPSQFPIVEEEGWFTLLNSSLPKWTHSQFRDVYGDIPEIAWINPNDASVLGLREGDEISLNNDLGTVTVAAVVTDGISQGALWSPRPLTGKNDALLNSLSSSEPQSIGKGPRFNSIRVRIQKKII